jgi:hypothetical protein
LKAVARRHVAGWFATLVMAAAAALFFAFTL